MQTERVTPTATPWRFSLRTLFLLTLAAAIFVWIISRPLWDMDERLALGTGYLTFAVGIAWNHVHEWRKKWLSLAGAGLVPATAVLVYYLLGTTTTFVPDVVGSILANTGAVFIAASIAWLIAVRLISPGKLNELPPLRRADAMQRRLALAVAFATVVVLVIGAASWYRGRTNWEEQRFWALETDMERSLALSPDGKLLATYCSIEEGRRKKGYLRVWDIEPRRPIELIKIACGDVASVMFTEDGRRLLLAPRDSNGPIQIVDATSGREFTRDATLQIPAVAAWIKAGNDELQMASPNGNWILRAVRELDKHGGQNEVLTVIDSKSSVTRYTIGNFRHLPRIEISPNGDLLAVGNDSYHFFETSSTLLNVRTGKSIPLVGDVQWFSVDERYAIGLESYQPYVDRPKWMGEWFFDLPFLRHLWLHGIHERFVEFNTTTGKAIRRSQWINAARLGDLTFSSDGKVAASIFWFGGYVTIWKAP